MKKKLIPAITLLLICFSKLYSYDPVDTVWTIDNFGKGVQYIAVSPDEKYVVTLHDYPNVGDYPKLYDAESGTFITELTGWKTGYYSGLEFSPDSRYVAVSGSGNKVVVWDIETKSIYKEFIHDSFESTTSNVCFSPSGDTIIYSASKGTVLDTKYYIFIYNFNTGQLLKKLDYIYSEGYPEEIQYSPAGNKLAIIPSSKNHFFLMDIDSMDKWKKVEYEDYQTPWVEFSPDGSKIVVCSGANVFILNTADTSLISHIDFSNDWLGCSAIFTSQEGYLLILGVDDSDGDLDFSLYIYNYLDSVAIKSYYLLGGSFMLSNDGQYLYYEDDFYANKIRLDWTQGIFFKPQSDSKYLIRPNPLDGKGTLLLDNLNSEQYTITLFDSNGKLIGKLYEGIPGSDTIELEINPGLVTRGVYYCTINSKSGKKAIKLMVE